MSLAIRAPTIQKPFARWDTFADCKAEQMQIGHSEESAGAICNTIQERAEKGALYKALGNLDILKGEDGDLVVGGHASWEIIDQDTPPDFITTEAMSNFLTKFFALPGEYRNISIDHHSLIIGKGLLQYPEENPRYFSHVHEKGMYLIAKIRNDKLSYTQHFRQLIIDGTYKMFSIRGKATRHEIIVMDKKIVRKVFDIDPVEVAIVKEGMNQKAEFQILKGKCPPCIEHLKKSYVAKGFSEEKALDMAEKLFKRVYERMQKEGKFKKAECEEGYHRNEHGECIRNKTAKAMTWEECIEQARNDPKVEDPEALCGYLKEEGAVKNLSFTQAPTKVSKQFRKEVAHVYDEAARKALPDLKLPEPRISASPPSREERLESLNLTSEAKIILKKHFPEHVKGDGDAS